MARAARGVLIAAALATAGCASIASEQDFDATLTVTPKADSSFFWWNEVTIDQDVNSVDGAHLQFVRLDVVPPAEDLTFLAEVQGEAVTPSERTKLVSKKGFPKDEPNVVLDVLYDGDVRPFFTEDGHKVRVEWSGRTNPAFTAWPPDGITVNVKVRLTLD